MQASGLLHVEAAQADGRWEAAYAPASEMTLPADFFEALARRPVAEAFFQTLNKANRYAIGFRLQTAKKPETRQRRLEKILSLLDNQQKIY